MSEELHDSVVRNSLQSIEFSVDTLTLAESPGSMILRAVCRSPSRILKVQANPPVPRWATSSARGKREMATRSSSVRSAGKFFPYIVRGDEFSNLQVV